MVFVQTTHIYPTPITQISLKVLHVKLYWYSVLGPTKTQCTASTVTNNLVLIASNLSEQQSRFTGFMVSSTTENKSSGWWHKQVICIQKQARRDGQYKPTPCVKRNLFVTPTVRVIISEKSENPWSLKGLTENISIQLFLHSCSRI